MDLIVRADSSIGSTLTYPHGPLGGDMANRQTALLVAVGCACLFSGCVERRFTVITDPPGALVYVNNKPIGPSPASVPFIYPGIYQIRLVMDGFEMQVIDQKVEAAFYAYPPIDLLAENIYPFVITDHQTFNYTMRKPGQQVNIDELRLRGEELRQQGRELPPPSVPADGGAPPPQPARPRGTPRPFETLPPPTETLPPPTASPPPLEPTPPPRS